MHYLIQLSQQPYVVGTDTILILQIQLSILPEIFKMMRCKAGIWTKSFMRASSA